MLRRFAAKLAAGVIIGLPAPNAQAWDHPGHMTTAAVAFAEIERQRPKLIEKIGLLFLKHPDPAPFWVASTEAKTEARPRRMFIQAARWADDVKWTSHDRNTWHSARWPVIAKDAPPKARKLAKARGDRPMGNAIEAAVLNAEVLSNPESKPEERALALGWVMHIVGDIHQPLHVSDYYTKEHLAGNAAGTMDYVWDPLRDSAMPLHVLWDSNTFRSTKIADINRNTQYLLTKYPRSSLPELTGYDGPNAFRRWARESYQLAVDFAYRIKTAPDPDKDADPNRLVANMVKYILTGVSPVKEAPKVPAAYWEKLQDVAHRRIALAGYRIADIVLAAADRIFADRALAGKVLDSMQRHGSTAN